MGKSHKRLRKKEGGEQVRRRNFASRVRTSRFWSNVFSKKKGGNKFVIATLRRARADARKKKKQEKMHEKNYEHVEKGE